MLTSLTAQQHMSILREYQHKKQRVPCASTASRNHILPQGPEKLKLYGQCGCSFLSPDSAKSHFHLFGPLEGNVREHF